jgi:YbbR domain-containing protein
LESLPSYVETDPILLSEYTGDASLKIGLNLPEGISLVGDQSVKVDIQIPPIVSAKTFSNVPVYVIGLDTDQRAQISPETVEIYLSGPQPILNNVKADELYAVIDCRNIQPDIIN